MLSGLTQQVSHRTPLFVLLFPLIRYRILQLICDNEQEYFYQQSIREKLKGGLSIPGAPPKSQGCLFVELVNELKLLKEDLVAWRLGAKGGEAASGDTTGVVSQSVSFSSKAPAGGASVQQGPNTARQSTSASGQHAGGHGHASFTELGPDQQSVTRLGSPPGLATPGRAGSGSHHSPTHSHLASHHSTLTPPTSALPSRGSSLKLPSANLPTRTLSIRLPGHHGPHAAGGGEASGMGRLVSRLMHRRTSYPSAEEEGGPGTRSGPLFHRPDTEGPSDTATSSQAVAGASSEPRLFRKSTLLIKKRGGSKKANASGGQQASSSAAGSQSSVATFQDQVIKFSPYVFLSRVWFS